MDQPTQQPVVNAAALALIKGINCEARHAANLLIDALEARLLSPAKHQSGKQELPAMSLSAALKAAAALRRREWKDNGLARYVKELPGELKRIPRLGSVIKPQSPRQAAASRQYAMRTMLAWIRSFSWSGRNTLGVDVALVDPGPMAEQGLERFAEILWDSRYAGYNTTGGSHGHT